MIEAKAKTEAETSRIWPRDRGQASRPNIRDANTRLRSIDIATRLIIGSIQSSGLSCIYDYVSYKGRR